MGSYGFAPNSAHFTGKKRLKKRKHKKRVKKKHIHRNKYERK